MTDLIIPSPGYVNLEARWDVPDHPNHAFVFCHPHPEHGGSMDVPLLEGVTRTLSARSVAVLRFNFRGVGGSTGRWSGGIDEIDDVAAAVATARMWYPDLPLVIGGWSFGGATSLRWIARDREDLAWVGIAAPISSALTPPLPPREALPAASRTFIIGDRDQFITVPEVEEYAAAVGGHVEVIKGSDHFFFYRHERVGDLVADAVAGAVNAG
ncbi:MAG: alpha/beta fold hydrolase [Acidimicrobiia bacterium]|nr:alpha/beta fold hydrolase [Acidimicrobiia bacterium]